MNMKKLILALLIAPNITFAANGSDGIGGIADAAFSLITGVLVPLAFAMCILYFFWGIAKYLRAGAGDEAAAKEGKNIMVWGAIGIFIAFSIWGIIAFIQSQLGITPLEVGIG